MAVCMGRVRSQLDHEVEIPSSLLKQCWMPSQTLTRCEGTTPSPDSLRLLGQDRDSINLNMLDLVNIVICVGMSVGLLPVRLHELTLGVVKVLVGVWRLLELVSCPGRICRA